MGLVNAQTFLNGTVGVDFARLKPNAWQRSVCSGAP